MIKRKIITVAIVLFAIVSGISQTIPEVLNKIGGTEKYPNANYLVVFDSINVDVQESGLSFVNTHRLYKVLNNKGAQHLRVIKYGYDPLSAYVEIRGVKIHHNDGSIEELDINTVLDYPAPAHMIYWGAREKMINIGLLEAGEGVEVNLFRKGFTYALLANDNNDDKYIPPMRGHFYDIVRFFGPEPIINMVYQVQVPKDKPMQYKFYNEPVKADAKLLGDKMQYTFEKNNVMPIKRESRMVSNDNIGPKLLMSTSPNWEAKSTWFYGVNEDYGSFDSTPEIDKKVAEVLIGAKDELDSISKLTHWVADNIRYSGISMGEGEGFTLHKGEMTFADRCGVCKDKAGMLITMLRAAGFESYAAMTMAGSRIDRIPADQFNHSVTTVKLSNGEYKMLDPTWVPFVRELWSSAEQQQNYLLGIPEGADLMKTPISDPMNHYFVMNIKGSLDKEGNLKGKLFVTAEGQSDAGIRRNFTSNFRQEWDRTLIREMKKISPNLQVTDINYGNPYQYQEGPIEIHVSFEIPSYAIQTTQGLIYNPISSTNIYKRIMGHLYFNTSNDTRKYDFRDRCSRDVKIVEDIKLPDYNKIDFLKEKVTSKGDIVSYTGKVTVRENNLEIKQHASYGKRVYKADEWLQFKNAVDNQRKVSNEPIIINF